jgi:hypothetical protein
VKRQAVALVVAAMLTAACDRSVVESATPAPTAPGPATGSSPSSSAAAGKPGVLPPVPPQRQVVGSAAHAMDELCVAPQVLRPPVQAPGEPPAEVEQLRQQVASVRHLDWRRPVAADAVGGQEMDDLVREAFDAQYPAGLYDRRTLAWRTIGAIGPQDDLHSAFLAFGAGQVVGFYNPQNGELVYLGDQELGLTERFTLAHELTHAIDDQHFDLRRLDTIASGCRDEELEGALGAVEGSAQFFANETLVAFPPSIEEALAALPAVFEGAGVPAGVPPLVQALETLPYTAGQAFITALDSRGGVDEVNQAIQRLPVTTEQILHPEKYPGDRPTPLGVPDIGARLGDGWVDLDVMQVGEAWLRELLHLRIDAGTADDAAAGWDGGVYRAWSDGDRVAVVLRTAWDFGTDAVAFADALRAWADAGSGSVSVGEPRGRRVEVAFASDRGTLAALIASDR